MECAVSDLVKEVKVILDRNQESDALLTPDDSDTLTQGKLIESRIEDAATIIESLAPPHKVNGSHYSPSPTWTFVNGLYVGKLELMDSVMRVLSVRASDWNRNARIITEHDEEYAYQNSKFGVRGNPDRPIAVLINNRGSNALELYSSSTNEGVSLSYVSYPKVENGNINLPQGLKDSVLYMCASLVCVSLGDMTSAANHRAVAYRLADIDEPSQTQ